MGRFKRGYEPLAREARKQEERKKQLRERLYEFYLKDDGEEADVRFLLEAPANIRVHQVQRKGANRKIFYDTVICSEDEDCPYCQMGDNPSFKGASLVIDRRPYEYTDENGKKKKGKNQVKLFLQGLKVMGQLERISKKYGLTDRDVTIVRLGTGTSTTYTIERGEKEPVTTKEIKNALPDWCRDDYDGSEESLYDILDAQLEKMVAKPDDYEDIDDSEYEEEDDDYEEDFESKKRKKRTTTTKRNSYLDDNDDDDDYDEVDGDDEDEDETFSKSKSRGRIKSSKRSLKSKRNRR